MLNLLKFESAKVDGSISDPEYEAISHHRGNGLARSMLIAMDELPTPGQD